MESFRDEMREISESSVRENQTPLKVRIAAVDDEPQFTQQIADIAEAFFKNRKEDFQVCQYQSPRELVMDVDHGMYFDIYFLDIEMPSMNGMALAQHIREVYLDPYIIFVTAHMKYSIKCYEYNTWRYIVKESVDQDLPQALESLLENMKKREYRFYIIDSPKSTAKLNYDDIYYLHVDGKYTYFHTARGIYRDRRSMKVALKLLDSPVFMLVNKSYVVHLRHIMEIRDQWAIMRDEEKIDLSRAQQNKVRKALLDLWSKKDGSGINH